jgi:hypothetical protein
MSSQEGGIQRNGSQCLGIMSVDIVLGYVTMTHPSAGLWSGRR